jgi:peptidoglycan/xylan/chitin deacetylase (PgdA/CDA1 family)
MRPASETLPRRRRGAAALRAIALVALSCAAALSAAAVDATEPCKPVYLTFDTGHMGVAPLVADVLRRHQVKVTFFLANEKTLDGGASLDAQWAPWWRERAAEGHLIGSHTFDHLIWRADRPAGGFDMRATAGEHSGQSLSVSPADYCAQLAQPAQRWQQITGQRMAPLFRAPGGKTSPALLKAARACGWLHVPWSAAGFLGDELPSESHPNAQLLARALRDIRSGDILLAHLGIWSRHDPWAPAVLEPLIVGLQARGFCLRTLADHPDYRAAVARGLPASTEANAGVRP